MLSGSIPLQAYRNTPPPLAGNDHAGHQQTCCYVTRCVHTDAFFSDLRCISPSSVAGQRANNLFVFGKLKLSPASIHSARILSPRRFSPSIPSHAIQVGQNSCLDCLAGYYCPDSASTTVTPCPEGQYCPEGSDVPNLCPAGTYSPSQGLYNESQCIDCDPGK